MQHNPVKIIYSGDRDIAVWVLEFLLQQGIKPIALMIPDEARASHGKQLKALCNYLPESHIIEGAAFRSPEKIAFLQGLEPDYILGIHFPYIIPKAVLDIAKEGMLNLHPAYLPYNRGWHTPSWALLEGTPYGATLHFMDEGLDTGDIVHQKQISVLPHDTANSIYQRVKALEFEVFKEAWPALVTKTYTRTSQAGLAGTLRKKSDLASVQEIDPQQMVKAGDLLLRLRALTTNDVKEAAYITVDGKKYHIQVSLTPDE